MTNNVLSRIPASALLLFAASASAFATGFTTVALLEATVGIGITATSSIVERGRYLRGLSRGR